MIDIEWREVDMKLFIGLMVEDVVALKNLMDSMGEPEITPAGYGRRRNWYYSVKGPGTNSFRLWVFEGEDSEEFSGCGLYGIGVSHAENGDTITHVLTEEGFDAFVARVKRIKAEVMAGLRQLGCSKADQVQYYAFRGED